jgi:hypothetical protein
MSDYDYRNPEDPFQRDTAYDPNVRTGNSAWGWIAAAVFVAIVLAVVFGMGPPAWAEWNQYRFQRDAGARDNADKAAGHQAFAGKSGAGKSSAASRSGAK